MTPGTRLTIEVQVTKVTTYERTRPGANGPDTVFRYVMKSPGLPILVYSGVNLNLRVDQYCQLRAFVKRVEPEYNCIRLRHPKVLKRDRQEKLL